MTSALYSTERTLSPSPVPRCLSTPMAKPLVADAKAALAADEGEVVAQLQQESFWVADEDLLQPCLAVFALEHS